MIENLYAGDRFRVIVSRDLLLQIIGPANIYMRLAIHEKKTTVLYPTKALLYIISVEKINNWIFKNLVRIKQFAVQNGEGLRAYKLYGFNYLSDSFSFCGGLYLKHQRR